MFHWLRTDDQQDVIENSKTLVTTAQQGNGWVFLCMWIWKIVLSLWTWNIVLSLKCLFDKEWQSDKWRRVFDPGQIYPF